MITVNKIDICCMQEIDVKKDYDCNLLTFAGYKIEIEKNDSKSRAGIYIKNEIKYRRRPDLEDSNAGLVILDLDLNIKYRLINLYRLFNPLGGISQKDYS